MSFNCFGKRSQILKLYHKEALRYHKKNSKSNKKNQKLTITKFVTVNSYQNSKESATAKTHLYCHSGVRLKKIYAKHLK